jgi:autotransporter-associated beta strand protein
MLRALNATWVYGRFLSGILWIISATTFFDTPQANAATYTWTGTGTGGLWSSTGTPGWNTASVPNAAGDTAQLNSITAATTTTQDIGAGVTIGNLGYGGSGNFNWTIALTNSLTFNNNGAGATITNSNSTANTGNALVLNAGTLTLADNLTISNTGASTAAFGAIQVNSTIGGTGNLTLSSTAAIGGALTSSSFPGAIRLQAANTFVGTTLIPFGLVTFNNTSFGTNAVNIITLGQSGSGSAMLASTAVAGAISNNIVVAAGSTGTITLGTLSTSAFTAYSGTITLNGSVSLTSPSTTNAMTISGAISGIGAITKVGGGITALTKSTNSYSGGTTITAGTLNFVSGALGTAGIITMNGGTLQWNGGNTQDVSDRIALVSATNATFDTNGNSITFATALGGHAAGKVTKVGTGVLTLTGANVYTGGTTITAGTLGFANGSLGTTGTITMNGGTLQWANGNTQDISGRFGMVAATNAVFDTNGNNVTFANGLSASTSLIVKSGTGTLTLTGISGYTGATTMTGGTLVLDLSINNSGVLSSTSTPILNGGTLKVSGKTGAFVSTQTMGNLTLNAGTASNIVLNPNGGTSTNLTLGSTWNVNASASLLIDLSAAGTSTLTSSPTLTNNIIGLGVAVKDSTGAGFATVVGGKVVRLAGTALTTNNSNTGTTGTDFTTTPSDPTYVTGKLTLVPTGPNATNSLAINALSTGTLDLGGAANVLSFVNGALLMTGASNYTIQNGQVGADSTTTTINQSGAGTLTISGTVGSTTGSLVTLGAGTISLTGTNTYSGGTTIGGGVLQIGGSGSLGSGTYAGAIGISGTLQISSSTAQTLSGIIGGAGTLLKDTSANTLTLSGPNTFTGSLVIQTGTLSVTGATAITTAGSLTLGDSTGVSNLADTLSYGPFTTGSFSKPIIVVGTNQVNSISPIGGATTGPTLSGSITLINANVTITSAGSGTSFSGGITGSGNVIVSDNGGNMSISATPVNNSGTLTFTGAGAGVENFGAAVGSNVTGIIFSNTGVSVVISGVLTVNSGGTTLTDTVSVRGLTLQGGISGSGNLILKNNNTMINGLTLSSASVNNVGSITNSGTGNGSSDISAVIGTNVTGVFQNSVSSGLTLSGANTYTAPTTISAGTLTLIGSGSFAASSTITVGTANLSTAILNVSALSSGANFSAGGFTLATGQTLAGHGTVNATGVGFSVPSGTFISPGTSAGTLKINGNSVIAGTYSFELSTAGSPSATPGGSSPGVAHTNHDVISITGTANVTGTINITSLGVNPGDTGFVNSQNYSWKILTSSGALTGTPTLGTVSGIDFTSLASGTFNLSTDPNNVYLNFSATPTPEPTAILGISALGLGLVGWMRRRQWLNCLGYKR